MATVSGMSRKKKAPQGRKPVPEGKRKVPKTLSLPRMVANLMRDYADRVDWNDICLRAIQAKLAEIAEEERQARGRSREQSREADEQARTRGAQRANEWIHSEATLREIEAVAKIAKGPLPSAAFDFDSAALVELVASEAGKDADDQWKLRWLDEALMPPDATTGISFLIGFWGAAAEHLSSLADAEGRPE